MPDTFSAKQVATRIGTDPKTLRKFLRSSDSPYIAVGQGKRYEFLVKELAEIKAAFDRWQTKAKTRSTAKPPPPAPPTHTPRNAPTGPKHAVALNDKGICMKCDMPAKHSIHIKPPRQVDPDSARRNREAEIVRSANYDDPASDWAEFEPTADDLSEIDDDGLEDLDDLIGELDGE